MSNAVLIAALELIRDFPVSDPHNQDAVNLKFIADKALREVDNPHAHKLNMLAAEQAAEEEDDDETNFDPDRTMPDENYTRYKPKDDSVFERIKLILVNSLDVEPDRVFLTANFQDDLGADSLDLIELIMHFEEKFKIEVSDDVAETLQTVEDAVKYAKANMKV